MSELKSMKIEQGEAEKLYGPASTMSEQPQYPYGLRLSLDDASLNKLDVSQLPRVGEKMMIEAVVEVVSVSAHESKEGPRRTLDLQITELCLEPYSEAEKKEEKSEEMQQDKGVSPDAFYAAGPEIRG